VEPERRVLLLAALLVEFDAMLAEEVREHLEARAEEWSQWSQAANPSEPCAESGDGASLPGARAGDSLA
jgi:hypothetical protein